MRFPGSISLSAETYRALLVEIGIDALPVADLFRVGHHHHRSHPDIIVMPITFCFYNTQCLLCIFFRRFPTGRIEFNDEVSTSIVACPAVIKRFGPVDMANGPIQRLAPFPETITLLESYGAKNNHNCVSC